MASRKWCIPLALKEGDFVNYEGYSYQVKELSEDFVIENLVSMTRTVTLSVVLEIPMTHAIPLDSKIEPDRMMA